MLVTNKLYRCADHYLILYPNQDIANSSGYYFREKAVAHPYSGLADDYCFSLSRRYQVPVTYALKNVPILVLNAGVNTRGDHLYEILAGDRKGWMIYRPWLYIKPLDE